MAPSTRETRSIDTSGSSSPTPLRVAILNDFTIVIRGLRAALDEFYPEAELLEPRDLDRADVVLFDTFGNPEAWSEVGEHLAAGRPLVIFSWAPPSPEYARYLRDGLMGYLPKTADAHSLVDALRTIAGGTPLHPEVATPEQVVGSWPAQDQGLTARESEILALIVQGKTNEEISQTMFLSINTVKTYIRTGYRKINVDSRTKAVLWAIDHGFAHGVMLGGE